MCLFFLAALFLAALSNAEPSNAEQSNAEQASEEPSYYTWVDAQGVMHNTLISADKPSAAAEIDPSEYLSEEDQQQAAKKIAADQKPFFTWTDGQGIIRSEAKPNVVVDFIAEELVYDAVFAPPFRVPDYVMQGLCCEAYADAFTAIAKLKGSASYQVDDSALPFQTQTGAVAAGFFSLFELTANEVLILKGYELPIDSSFEVIALNKYFKPLYLASELKGIFSEQTWKDVAYKKILLEVSDEEVKYLVVFVRQAQQALTQYRLSLMRDQLVD